RRDRQFARDHHRRHAQAAAGEGQARQEFAQRWRARQSRLHRQATSLLRRQVPADADLRARGARRRQPHRRPGADRGARFDHGAQSRRPARGRYARQSGDHGGGRPLNGMAKASAKKMLTTTRKARAKRKVDPVVPEIVRNGVIAVTEEMKTNLMRTAYNIIIYEALDFTTGLFTPQGETISIGIGLPMFIRGMAETVRAKIRHFGAGNIRPGDIYVTNDSYLTGSHLNHVTLTLPIFHKGRLVAFSCCMAHWLDIGGILGGMSTDIFSEGLQIPILKYQDRGVVNATVVEIIRQNVRLPSRAMGDLRAQVTAVKTGERRFLELIERYGRDAVLASIAAIIDHAEAMARARTRTIPDGTYEAESYMDDDGIDIGQKVPIRVRVVVAGDEMTVDLSEVSKQVRGFYNSGITTGHACAQVAYKCLTSPTD